MEDYCTFSFEIIASYSMIYQNIVTIHASTPAGSSVKCGRFSRRRDSLPFIENNGPFVMSRSKSSKRWLQEHFDDYYVKKAQDEGYRSRAVYKLKELDEREKLLKPGLSVIDLGAAPGGWTQYISQRLDGQGTIIALDILAMDAMADVTMIIGDFQEQEVFDKLLQACPDKGVDLILSDMAPNMSGNPAIDIPKSMGLAELAMDLCCSILKPGGTLLMKVFHGEGFEDLLAVARKQFTRVSMRKPKASRPRSREVYLVAKGHKMV